MTNERDGDVNGESRRLPVTYVVPDDLRALFVDFSIINHSNDAFFLNFYQLERPPSLSAQELRNIDTINATCVARLALTPQHIRNFHKALEENIKKFDARSSDDRVLREGEAE